MRRLNPALTFSPTLNAAQGSQQLLAQNDRRASLTIQNLAPASVPTAILYYAFSTNAGPNNGVALGPGRGVIIDVICPTNALFIYMDNVAGQPLTIIEISWSF